MKLPISGLRVPTVDVPTRSFEVVARDQVSLGHVDFAHHALPVAVHYLVRCSSAVPRGWLCRHAFDSQINELGHGTGGGRHDRRKGS